ncbi:hypothetical protein F5Y15DRAFT_415875 [Xylariaceae sp. FL0016]|nr:hypothetical protein F5Y15DRAFT_415875 [Xylariaceae sp. FL0016]
MAAPGSHKPAATKAHPRRDDHKPRSRRDAHQPATPPGQGREGGGEEEEVYVLTLETDPHLQRTMSALRGRYFPRRRLKVDAHITLFHALPGAHLPAIAADIASVAAATVPFGVTAETETPFRMRRGVGVRVAGLGPAARVREELRGRWGVGGHAWLSDQDEGRWRGHYTLVNKCDDEEVLGACESEVKGLGVLKGRAVGLGLWAYERGYWKGVESWEFAGEKQRNLVGR